MLRLLLTCLAFLSGLVALGAPAQAIAAESSVTRSADDETCDPEKENAKCVCHTAVRMRDWWVTFERVCRKRKPDIFLPTVQLGPDRARE